MSFTVTKEKLMAQVVFKAVTRLHSSPISLFVSKLVTVIIYFSNLDLDPRDDKAKTKSRLNTVPEGSFVCMKMPEKFFPL